MERTSEVGPDTVPRIVLGTRIRRFRGIVLVSTGPTSFELVDSGAYIFRNIDGRTSVRALATRLAAEYDLEESEALIDTREFVEWLREQGSVVAMPVGSPGLSAD